MRKNKKKLEQIAKQHVHSLFDTALLVFDQTPSLANRLMQLARKTAMKYKIGFTREQKIHYCTSCGGYLKMGTNARVRIQHGKVIITCQQCHHYRRIPL